MRVVGVVPSRLAATRLPNKPLVDIGGKPMIQRVWERARQATCLDELIVATPDREILEAVIAFGGQADITSDRHRSGTDRVAEIADRTEADIFVNVQGDEPLIDPASIDLVVSPLLEDGSVVMTSLMCPCPPEDLDNPACVKVVCDSRLNALYFSRARIPHQRQPGVGQGVCQHIGLYAYRKPFLLEFARMEPTPLESTEALEQLRVLEYGYPIRMVAIDRAPLSVDTPDDLERVVRIIEGGDLER